MDTFLSTGQDGLFYRGVFPYMSMQRKMSPAVAKTQYYDEYIMQNAHKLFFKHNLPLISFASNHPTHPRLDSTTASQLSSLQNTAKKTKTS